MFLDVSCPLSFSFDSRPLLWGKIFRSTLQICYLNAESSADSLHIDAVVLVAVPLLSISIVLLLADSTQYIWESTYGKLPVNEHSFRGYTHLVTPWIPLWKGNPTSVSIYTPGAWGACGQQQAVTAPGEQCCHCLGCHPKE